MRFLILSAAALTAAFTVAFPAAAQVITFDDAVDESTSYTHGGVTFTAEAGTFMTMGGGEPQAYIDQPGLGTLTASGAEIRVDFTGGQTGAIGFGYALYGGTGIVPAALHFTLYDSNNVQIADVTSTAIQGTSIAPGNWVSLSFIGTAAYGLFDFDDQQGFMDLIDNFTLGSGDPPSAGSVPEPGSWLLMTAGLGLAGAALRARKRAAAPA